MDGRSLRLSEVLSTPLSMPELPTDCGDWLADRAPLSLVCLASPEGSPLGGGRGEVTSRWPAESQRRSSQDRDKDGQVKPTTWGETIVLAYCPPCVPSRAYVKGTAEKAHCPQRPQISATPSEEPALPAHHKTEQGSQRPRENLSSGQRGLCTCSLLATDLGDGSPPRAPSQHDRGVPTGASLVPSFLFRRWEASHTELSTWDSGESPLFTGRFSQENRSLPFLTHFSITCKCGGNQTHTDKHRK